jgi:hypothetical protein
VWGWRNHPWLAAPLCAFAWAEHHRVFSSDGRLKLAALSGPGFRDLQLGSFARIPQSSQILRLTFT